MSFLQPHPDYSPSLHRLLCSRLHR